MPDTFEIRGLAELRAGFLAAPEALNHAEQLAITRSMFIVEAAAKDLAPVRTSRLRSSITPVFHGGAKPYAVVGTNVVYARMIEYGAPAGFPINYANGRRTKKGQTRPYVAHLRQNRRGFQYMTRGLISNIPRITDEFRNAYVKFLNALKGV